MFVTFYELGDLPNSASSTSRVHVIVGRPPDYGVFYDSERNLINEPNIKQFGSWFRQGRLENRLAPSGVLGSPMSEVPRLSPSNFQREARSGALGSSVYFPDREVQISARRFVSYPCWAVPDKRIVFSWSVF